MKQKIDRMINTQHVSTRAIAMVMCIVMLITAIGAGSVLTAIAVEFQPSDAEVLAEAATLGADVDAAEQNSDEGEDQDLAKEDALDSFEENYENDFFKSLKEDIAITGAEADLAASGSPNYISYGYKADGNSSTLSSNKVSGATITFTSENTNDYYFVSATDDGNYSSSMYSNAYPGYSYSGYTNNAGGSGNNNHSYNDGKINWVESYKATVSGIKLSVVSGTTVTVTYNNSTGIYEVTASSGGSSGGGESGGSSGGQSIDDYTEADADWTKILNGTDVSFYITSYTDSNANATLVNSSGAEVTKTRHGMIESNWGKSYIQVAKSSLSTYNHISNNVGWSGVTVSAISSADGGESYKGDGSGASSATETTASTTGIKASYNKFETMTISTTASGTKTSFINSGSTGTYDLYVRYYLKYNNKFYYLEDLTHKATTSATVSTFDLFGLEPGSYKLITAGVDSKDYVRYILDEDDFTITDITGAPTIEKSENKVIVNTSMSPSYIYQWQGTGSGTHYAVTDSSVSKYSYNSRNIYTRTSTTNPGVILKSNKSWDNDNYKLSNNIGTGTTSGQTITDGNYYKKYDSKVNDTTWDSFTHLSTALTIDGETDPVTIGTGDTVPITNTPSGTLTTTTATDKSSVMAKYVYYVVAPDGTATRINSTFTESNTYDFTPTTPGTYKVFSYVQDMWGYETALSDNIMTINVQQAYKVTVKSNSSRLGTGTADPANAIPGVTVTVTIEDNMGEFSAITVKDASGTAVSTTTATAGEEYTFTMPASAATVNLTFDEMSGSSDFYYNGYDSNGSPLSGYYGKQMSLGKVNGEEYSYYHVEDRTGVDQLFTVSYGNPDYSSAYVYFQVPDNWTDTNALCCNHAQGVYFLTSDEVMVQDWTEMTWDRTDGSKKQWKALIPDGARYAYFKDWTNSKQTERVDLKDNNGFYVYDGGYDTGTGQYKVKGFNNNDGLGRVGNMYENYNGTGKYTNNFSTSGFFAHNATRGGSHAYTKANGLGSSSNDYYIIVLYKGKTYTINDETKTIDKDPEIIWMKELPGAEDIDASTVNVYAKDGPIVIDWNNKGSSGASTSSGTAYGFSLIADTKIYDSDDSAIGTDHNDDGASYESASVEVTSDYGTDVVIKTTVSSSYTSKYYLKGWCINGETYACGDNVKGVNAESAGTASGSDKVYTMTYTVPAGTENNAKIEITPIYYLLSTYKNFYSITTVTFYLEGYNTISDKWGDTPYIYPFYGNLNNVDNSFGVYPGQPMVYANGQYSVEVPINKNVPIAKSPGSTAVKGITINNGYADHVHRNLVNKWTDHDNDADHKQTYDYDDFYKIYEECLKNGSEHPNAIFFRIQDEDTVYNRSQYGGGKSGQFASGDSNISISTIESSGNGWELLTNRYGHAINLFGTQVTDPTTQTATTDTSNALYIVSTGYNANIAGDYGTMWKIYNGSGQLISSGGGRMGVPPSVLLLRGDASGYTNTGITYPSANRSVEGVGSYTDSISDYETIYKALHSSSYTGKRVYITYEKDAQDSRNDASGTGAYRLDGRWYYTHASDNVQSTIGIEYWDEDNGTWVTDTIPSGSTTGSHTGCTAKFSNDSTTSPTYVINDNETYSFYASTVSGWKFDSWQIKYSSTSYDPISTNISATMPATASYNIVARFVPVVSGSLTINHTLNSASSCEGEVTMAVNVYTDSTLTTKVSGFSEKTGSRVYLDDTYISNNNSYYIKVELKTTPKYDGKVSEFTYDAFNTTKSITATTSPASLPGSENTLTTSTFSFPVSDLYNVGTQSTKMLNYTSLIDETLHYYNLVYNFTDRAGASKSYTSKGVLSLSDYKKVVTDQAAHELDDSFLVTKAPFESNFLKKNELTAGEISWNGTTHTYSAMSTFNQQNDVPNYHVVFELPYSYYNAANSSLTPPVKKYTVQPTNDVNEYNVSTPTFDLLATYNTFVTVGATSSAVGSQTNVSKVTDTADVNHTGNDFITAPDELMDGSTTMYFRYWKINKLNSDGTAGDLVTYLYYPDFHYRVYSDYYVEAVYSDKEEDFWKFNYSEEDNDTVDCSVLYLGDSRNQWNDGSAASTTSSTTAADKIYNDFIFHYTYKGQELSSSEDVEVGMILERATYLDTSDSNKEKWLAGSTSVNDMNYYRAEYGGSTAKSTESTRKTAISTALSGGTSLPSGTVKVTWDNSELNNKNFTEQNYSVFSQYGQTVANDTITFAKDNTIDNYVYRAYAYIYDEVNDEYVLSDPVYFCMRYTSNLKYTE